MKLLLLAAVGSLVAMIVKRTGLGRRIRKSSGTDDFIQHRHDPLLHDHSHTHVVHNRREGADQVVGEWEHLTSEHTHKHNHADLVHAHAPHENVEREHLGESHIHDHEHPEKS